MDDKSYPMPLSGSYMSGRRPGRFGPAWALLPKDQQPLVLESLTPTCESVCGSNNSFLLHPSHQPTRKASSFP